ncbi:MAG: hypothetical protein HGA25_07145, partial [Clostridiales bacterium]|nr:hypothetical protein [Clostridiales bacterium]
MALPAHKRIEFEQTYTSAEFETLSEFNEHYELLDGKLVEKHIPGYDHSKIARRITKAYDRFDPDEKLGELL